ncbi:class I SAM-dependent methyltransferase [Hymenobacter sp. YC55]|uniref:class I SAM-dependent methyltransferase n=1 Tax=Hymenobacter sp. YC55 TaxID=3034019 RepID=UPI0023F7E3D6|nr:class I SAM-dependent methyltransferase [Hymenobacter sp. YC55]MDF7812729.1 class I SAM-dependent methyltransferase [Hymenobacter sp. YC55]
MEPILQPAINTFAAQPSCVAGDKANLHTSYFMPAPTNDATHYIGDELALFEHATHWKAYYGARLRPFLRGKVLEVGAGIGGTTRTLCDGKQTDWLCLEPDASLASRIESMMAQRELPAYCRLHVGTLEDLPATDSQFDAILYIDVIEHIEDDAAELRRAYERLAPGGAILIIVPAHQWLFSPFDEAIGHFRRYSRPMLRRVLPAGSQIRELVYLDSVGLLASAANKLMLRQSYPTLAQIKFWDRTIVPVSRFADRLTGFSLGKSVLGVVQKPK